MMTKKAAGSSVVAMRAHFPLENSLYKVKVEIKSSDIQNNSNQLPYVKTLPDPWK